MDEDAKMTKKIAVIIPALNEEESIADVIDNVFSIDLQDSDYELDIEVIDGRSSDRTVEIARAKGANVIVQQGNGKGVGIRQIIDLCFPNHVVNRTLSLTNGSCDQLPELTSLLDTNYVIMLDADGTYPPKYIPDIIEALEGGEDVVMGSRFKGTIEEGAMTQMNRVGNIILSNIASILYNHKCSDICTGMWGFRTDALKVLELESKHFELEAELFAESIKKGLNVGEIAINYLPRKGETNLVPMAAGVSILTMIVKRRFWNAGGGFGFRSMKTSERSANSIRSG